MKLMIYTVYDKKAQIYHPPYYCHNVGHATRMFKTMFQQKESVINQYPEDFQVFELGEFNDSTGKMIGYQQPNFICTAADLISVDLQKPEVKNAKSNQND